MLEFLPLLMERLSVLKTKSIFIRQAIFPPANRRRDRYGGTGRANSPGSGLTPPSRGVWPEIGIEQPVWDESLQLQGFLGFLE
jgi:hypothetical protein